MSADLTFVGTRLGENDTFPEKNFILPAKAAAADPYTSTNDSNYKVFLIFATFVTRLGKYAKSPLAFTHV